MSTQEKPATLYASDLAHENFPFLERLPQFAREGIGRILVLTPEDITDEKAKDRMALNRRFNNDEITIFEYEKAVEENYIDSSKIGYDALEKLSPTHNQALQSSIAYEELGKDLLMGFTSTLSIDTDITAKDNFTLILVTPRADETKEESASGLTNGFLKPKEIKNLPGTDEDWLNASLIHEINHNPNFTITGLGAEIPADTGVQKHWAKAIFNTQAHASQLVPQAWLEMRAIGSFSPRGGTSHATNAAIQSGDEGLPPNGTEEQFKDALDETTKYTFFSITPFFPSLYLYPAINLVNGAPLAEGEPVCVINKADEVILQEMIKDPYAADFNDKRNTLSEETGSVLWQAVYNDHADLGSYQSMANRPLFFKTTYEKYKNGDYDPAPIGKQYAYEFLKAADKYAPDVFEAKGLDINSITAPTFDKNGQFVEPVSGANTIKVNP